MKKSNKCLKEWNATLEALGQGKQTILIRNYKTNISEFLLYPTVSYAKNNNYLKNFQMKYHTFVEENALPQKKDNKILIKYFATMEKIVEKPVNKLPSEKYYIWSKDQVKDYIKEKTAFIWFLRVNKLRDPYWAEPTVGPIIFANLKDEVSLDGMEPVLNDSEFAKSTDNIK